jgi:hypothetical protein
VAPACIGDCDGNSTVTVNELILGVEIALGRRAVATCEAFDPDGSGAVTIDELEAGVANSMFDCVLPIRAAR